MRSEAVIINKILEDPTHYLKALDKGLKSELFIEFKPQYEFLISYFSRYGGMPSVDVFQEYYPGWEVTNSTDPFDYWLDRLRQDKSLLVQNSGFEEWLEARKKESDPDKLARIIIKLASTLQTSIASTKDVDLNDVEAEKTLYKKKKGDGIQRIPLGLIKLDEEIGGAKPGDLGILMGPPENFKTWILLMMAHHVWAEQEEPCLVISKEMDEIDMWNRLSWFDFRFNFTAFEKGLLGHDLEERYFELLAEKRKGRPTMIISADDGGLGQGGGVSLVAAKIDQYKPKICFIDGGYLLTDDSGQKGYQGIANVFRDIKSLARNKEIPIIVTTHPQRLKDQKTGGELRRKLIMQDVAEAWNIARDADYMIGIRTVAPGVLNIYKIKCRRGKNFDFQLNFDLDEGNIGELAEEIVEDEIQEEHHELRFD
jgi:hypothetical protein